MQPAGFEAVCKNVHMNTILGKVSVTSGHMLDGISLNFLESLGLSVDVKAHRVPEVDYLLPHLERGIVRGYSVRK